MTGPATRPATPTLTLAAAVAVAVAFLIHAPPARAEAGEEAFALVVAHNQSLDPTLRPLRYADDDGARFYEWVSSFARRTVLLAVLDEETQRTFPELGPRARPPTRAELVAVMHSLAEEMKQRRAAGRRTVFCFYFAGHGDVGTDRQGYINLVDGRFSRSDLYREIIARSPADLNHLIIDACNSYFLVNARGVQARQGTPEEAIRSFLSQESLDRYPQTGVVQCAIRAPAWPSSPALRGSTAPRTGRLQPSAPADR
jgi:hypothetical protein